jgi:hypothetical protein
MLGPSGE